MKQLRRTSFGALVVAGCVLAWAMAGGGAPQAERRHEAEPGLVVERWQAPATSSVKSPPMITLVRVDPARFSFHLFTARDHGGARSAPRWQRDFDLVGVINAGMYMPNERSAGLMVDGDRVNNGYDNPAYGGFLCFGPRDPEAAPVTIAGRTCDGFDLAALRRDYRVVVQGYRLLGCSREPMRWTDRKLYSTAAIGLDDRGWMVLIHTGTSYLMSDLTRWLARAELGLSAAIFVEGGSHASLLVEQDGLEVRQAGARGANSMGDTEFRNVPNVIGFRRLPDSR